LFSHSQVVCVPAYNTGDDVIFGGDISSNDCHEQCGCLPACNNKETPFFLVTRLGFDLHDCNIYLCNKC
jgi:hypothetical protein